MNYYVEVYEIETGVVVERMGPMNFAKAKKVIDGVKRNMNHEKYSARILGEVE